MPASRRPELPENVIVAPGETVVGLFAIQMSTIGMKELRMMRKVLSRLDFRRALGLKRAGKSYYAENQRNHLIRSNTKLRRENQILRWILLDR